MTAREAEKIVRKKYPRARLGRCWKESGFIITSGGGAVMLSGYCATAAKAWIDAAKRIQDWSQIK